MRNPVGSRSAAPELLLVLLAAGCGSETGGSPATGFVDPSITRLDTLGWLGATTQPLTLPLTVTRDGEAHDPGGVVLRELDVDGVLAAAGAAPGDVVVRVGEDWVPLKENPTLDLLGLVERAISGGKTEVALECWRDGRLVTLSAPLSQPALEIGLPVAVERFEQGARAAAGHLVAWQRADGGWSSGTPEDELALDSLASLALLAAGAGEEGAPPPQRDAIAAASARVESLLGQEGSGQRAESLALATAFLAERIGPLPPEVLVRAAPRVMTFTTQGAAPLSIDGALAEGMSIQFQAASSEQIEEMLRSAGGDVQVITSGGGGEGLPEGMEHIELPEGASFHVGRVATVGAPGEGVELPDGAMVPGPGTPPLAELLAELDPGRPAALDGLRIAVDRLIECQEDDGGWGDVTSGETDRLLATSLALWSIGAAQRVGLEIDGASVEKGCAFLRPLVHEGKMAAAVARGADRRREAARAASVAAAYRALGCPERDEFLEALLEFSDARGQAVLEAPAARPFHLLATAVLRRQRGLATWQQFYDEFRLALVAWQKPDGRFVLPPSPEPGSLETALAGEPFDAAVGLLLTAMQSERVPVFLGLAENPLAPAIDGAGQRVERLSPATTGMPAMVPGEVQRVTDPAEIEKLLESLGIEGGVEGVLERSHQVGGREDGGKDGRDRDGE